MTEITVCPQCEFPGHSVTICCRVGGDVFGGDVFDDDDVENFQRGRFGQNHSPVQTAFVLKLATRSIWNIEFFYIKKDFRLFQIRNVGLPFEH